MSWAIVADSSCNLRSFEPQAPDCVYRFAPLKINVAGDEFIDDASLDVAELNRRVSAEETASSSACPSVGEWADLFRQADNIIAITISANLSGSYEAAVMARDIVRERYFGESPRAAEKTEPEEERGGSNIIDPNARGASALGYSSFDALKADRTKQHPDATFNDVTAHICDLEQSSTVLFLLSSYENLAKAGRMPKMAGVLANKLKIRILGTASNEGTIKVVGPARSQKKAFEKIVGCMKGDGYAGGSVYIDHAFNERAAQELSDRIHQDWPDAEITIMPCGGLCSYYAEEDGLIIGYGW